MAFHPPFVAFVDHESQRIISRHHSIFSRESFACRFNSRTPDDVATHTDLQKNSIEIRILQTVQNVTDIALLRLSPSLPDYVASPDHRQLSATLPESHAWEVRLHSKPMSGTRAITTSNTFSFHTFTQRYKCTAFCASSG